MNYQSRGRSRQIRELLKWNNRHGLLFKSYLKGRKKEKNQSNYREGSATQLGIE